MKVYTHWVSWHLVVITKCYQHLSVLAMLIFHSFFDKGEKYHQKAKKEESAVRDILHGKVVG